jgi:hypothetical protein
MTTIEQPTGRAIRPFHVEFPGEALADLRRRPEATRGKAAGTAVAAEPAGGRTT